MATIAIVDLENLHESYKGIEKEYSQCSERFLYFSATCVHLDPEIDLDIAFKLRLYSGLIGIDNSKLDKHFKLFKILRLFAILRDASGFVFDYSEKDPGNSYELLVQ